MTRSIGGGLIADVKPTLAPDQVAELVRGVAGPAAEARRLGVEGMESQAYRVACADGPAYCLRINRDVRGFGKDRWAHEILADRLPVPRVVDAGWYDEAHAYCLSEWLPGRTVQDVADSALLPSLDRAWRAVHATDIAAIRGYGELDVVTLSAPYESWHAVLLAPLRTLRAQGTFECGDIVERYEALVAGCPDERGLLHGDWGSNNLLTDGREVTGVLDWEAVAVGDPLHDMVGAHFWATWLVCMRQQADYCDEVLQDEPDYERRRRCYGLHVGLREVADAITEGDDHHAEWAVGRCRELFAG